MPDLQDHLELINHKFNNDAFSEQDTIRQKHWQTILVMILVCGNQQDTKSIAQ